MLPAIDVTCPYCGERIELLVDPSAGDQEYIEDCSVCCRPIRIDVAADDAAGPRVVVHAEDEA